MENFYSQEELKKLKFKSLGENVKISRKASIYNPEQMELSSNIRIDDFCILSGNIVFGNYIHISAYTSIHGSAGVILDDFATISTHCTVFTSNDDYLGYGMTNPMIPDEFRKIFSAPVHINKHVIIGSHSTVMPGVVLAEGSAFGSFSFISEDTEKWSVNAGIPCKRIKERCKNVLEVERKFTEYIKEI